MVTGIRNSTQSPGNRNKSNDAMAKVKLWPTVNAVAIKAALPACLRSNLATRARR